MDVDAGAGRAGRGARRRRAGVRAAGRGEGARAARSSSRRTCPPTITTDAQRLQQVLRNLLANAIKFTDAGRSSWRSRRCRRAPCSACRRWTARSVIAFAVRDTGIGIPARQAGDDLRGVPAGRRHHQPQVRRHRARACRSPRSWRGMLGGRDRGHLRGRRGLGVHAAAARRAARARRHGPDARRLGAGSLPGPGSAADPAAPLSGRPPVLRSAPGTCAWRPVAPALAAPPC